MLMKTALVISFYESSNLGDLALSATIDQIVKQSGYELIRYDFCKCRRPQQFAISSVGASPAFIPFRSVVKRLFVQMVKRPVSFLMGRVNSEVLFLWFIRKIRRQQCEISSEDFRRADIVVFGGGNMIMDISPNWPFLVGEYARLSQQFRKPLYFIYMGVGPIKSKYSVRILRRAMSSAVRISVRDKLSKKVCMQLVDKKKILLTVDPVFSLTTESSDVPLVPSKELKARMTIGVCVLGEMCFCGKAEHEDYLYAVQGLIEQVNATSKLPVRLMLFSTEARDYLAVRQLYSRLKGEQKNCLTIVEVKSVDGLLNFYDKLDYLIGGRMHSMIIAHTNLLPHIGVIWQDKIIGFGQLTKAEDRMYTVETLKLKRMQIAGEIRSAYGDEKLVSQMDKINQHLREIVAEGNILP